jgi:sensor domain CHASE-containing protein
MTEDYIRPPIVALEPSSRRFAVWRFRIVLLLLFAALAIGTFFLVRAILDRSQNGDAQAMSSAYVSRTALR